jgi:hypothetical protein
MPMSAMGRKRSWQVWVESGHYFLDRHRLPVAISVSQSIALEVPRSRANAASRPKVVTLKITSECGPAVSPSTRRKTASENMARKAASHRIAFLCKPTPMTAMGGKRPLGSVGVPSIKQDAHDQEQRSSSSDHEERQLRVRFCGEFACISILNRNAVAVVSYRNRADKHDQERT